MRTIQAYTYEVSAFVSADLYPCTHIRLMPALLVDVITRLLPLVIGLAP